MLVPFGTTMQPSNHHPRIDVASMSKWSGAMTNEITVRRQWTQRMVDVDKVEKEKKKRAKTKQMAHQDELHVLCSVDAVPWHSSLYNFPGQQPEQGYCPVFHKAEYPTVSKNHKVKLTPQMLQAHQRVLREKEIGREIQQVPSETEKQSQHRKTGFKKACFITSSLDLERSQEVFERELKKRDKQWKREQERRQNPQPSTPTSASGSIGCMAFLTCISAGSTEKLKAFTVSVGCQSNKFVRNEPRSGATTEMMTQLLERYMDA